MRFVNPAGLLVGLLAIPIVVLHMLRPRRPSLEVSSTYLWRSLDQPVSSATPWQRLPPSLLLLLQLLAVALLALGVARPVILTKVGLARHTVFIVDASGSMAAKEVGGGDRMADARHRALSLRRQLPAGGVASVVLAGAQPRALLTSSPDPRAFAKAIDGARASAGRADFGAAFRLAESLETPGTPIGFVLLSDGGLGDSAALIPPGTRYEDVGRGSDNQAVSHLSVDPLGSSLHVRAQVANFGTRAVTRTLRVLVDGREVLRRPVGLARHGSATVSADVPAGDRVEAVLDGQDLLAVDDRAVTTSATRPPIRVLLAGKPDLFLERLLAAIPGVTVERSATSRSADGLDLAIYDGVAVPADPGAPVLAIAPPAGGPGVTVSGEVKEPVATLVRTDDALLAGLDFSALAIARAQKLAAPGDEILLAADSTPLLVRGTRGGRPFAYLGFSLQESNLALQVSFPVLGDRLLGQLAGTAQPISDLRVGDTLPVGTSGAGSEVVDPGGERALVAPGAPAPSATEPGFWRITTAGRARTVAVNAAPEESVIAPVRHLAVPAAGAGAKGRLPRGEHGVTAWIVAVLLVVLGLELMASRRRRGVSRRQWRVALALRAVIVAALVLALLEVALPRTGSGVATAFLIDASDSLGAGGKAAAVDWVKSALGHQPKGSRAGVALFGADARLELTVQQRAHLLAPAVVVDPTRTDLAGALRLAAAVLPSDARRRVVVVSDGRVTEGSVGPEARLLRSAGIQVDVHVVGQAGGPDVALRRLDAPDRVTRTDTVVLRVTLHSTSAQPGRLTIDRDGAVVLDRVVDLTPGDSVVEVAASPGPPGMHRYRAQLTAASDAVKENDSAFAVVEVVGPDRILMVEGQPGEGSQMRSALTAAGLQVDVSEPGALPTVDRLAGYQSTVLVDVDALAFTPIQVETLAAASRDLGRGLVVVGGDHSYALGGYLDSDLEKILPVTSDVKDPKRRVPVAEVLVIDTSGSMAEADTVGGQPKVDVARAAASRAVASLQPGDEVGIIAFNQSPITVLPLQKLPARSVSEAAISKLQADGGTNLYDPIVAAGNALKKSKAPLRHIIFFTDGQSDQANLPALAADLAKQGITITVLATGQGADRHLQAVAQQGKGRYYDLVDVSKLPQILADETKTAARRLVSEGEFYPKVVSSEASVSQLQSSPPLLGYLASTAKPASRHLLEIGKDDDPLLASWRLGLGTVTSWTSDASARWSQRWATWPGYVGFWSGVVKSSFPIGGSGASVRAELIGDKVRVTLEGETPFVDGATATARVVGPDLVARTVALDRTSGTTFVGEIGATAPGGYAVAAVADGPGGPLASVTSAVARGYSPEYQPGSPDRTLLISVSKATGGRGEIGPARAFDRGTLPAGRGRAPLTGLLLLLAALAWPIDVALRRLAFHGEAREIATRQLRRARSTFIRRPPKPGTVPPGRRPAGQPDPGSPDTVGPEARPDEPAVPADAPVPASLGRLLDRTRGERSRRGGGGGAGTSGDGAG